MDVTTTTGIMLTKDEWRTAELTVNGGEVRVLRTQCVAMSTSGTVISNGIACVPWADVLTRYWTFPGVEEDQLLNLVNHQLEAEMPVALDLLTWGVRKVRANVSGKTAWHVFAQAVRTKRVDQCRQVLGGAGILTTPAEAIGAFYRFALKTAKSKGNDILILATGQEWQVVFFVDGLVRSVRRIRGAGESMDLLMMQCKNLIDVESTDGSAERILWCADAKVLEHRERLETIVNKRVMQVEFDARLIDSQGQSFADPQPATYAVAIGAALAGLFDREELICLAGEPESKEPEGLTRFKKILSHTRRWSAVAAGLVILAMTIHLYGLSHENTIMQELLDQAESSQPQVSELESKIELTKRLREYRIDVEGILVDICRAVPNTIVVSSIQMSREHKLTIRGTTKDPKAIFIFVDTLRKSRRLKNINPENIESAKGSFTLVAEMAGAKKFGGRGGRGGLWN